MRFTACVVVVCMVWSVPVPAQRAQPSAVTSSAAGAHGNVRSAQVDTIPRLRAERIVLGAVIGAVALATAGAMYEAGQCEAPTCERPIKGAVGGAVMGGVLGALFGWLFALPREAT